MSRLERLHTEGRLSRTDVTRAQAGALLAFHTYLERSLERLFLGLVMGRLASSSASGPLVSIKSEVVARSVVSGGRNYVDWLPYENYTLKRANAFLSAGRPFSTLSGPDYAPFDRLTVIRNAIAHESSYAVAKFRKAFVKGKALPPDQRGAAGYLRGQHRPGVSRFELVMTEVVLAFNKLCA
jgi:hypothetical protein